MLFKHQLCSSLLDIKVLDLLSDSLTLGVRAEVEEKRQVALVSYLVLEKPF